MTDAPNTRSQKYVVRIVQWAPETSVSEEIADIFRNYNIDDFVIIIIIMIKIIAMMIKLITIIIIVIIILRIRKMMMY